MGGPNGGSSQTNRVTAVTSELMNSVLGDVLTLIQKNIGVAEAPWMNRIASEFRVHIYLYKTVAYVPCGI